MDYIMIWYERGILEMFSRSYAKMGIGSPLGETRDCIKDFSAWAQSLHGTV